MEELLKQKRQIEKEEKQILAELQKRFHSIKSLGILDEEMSKIYNQYSNIIDKRMEIENKILTLVEQEAMKTIDNK